VIEFGKLPSQPMRDIFRDILSKGGTLFHNETPRPNAALKKSGHMQFRHDPEKLRSWYRCVSRETKSKSAKISKGGIVIVAVRDKVVPYACSYGCLLVQSYVKFQCPKQSSQIIVNV